MRHFILKESFIAILTPRRYFWGIDQLTAYVSLDFTAASGMPKSFYSFKEQAQMCYQMNNKTYLVTISRLETEITYLLSRLRLEQN